MEELEIINDLEDFDLEDTKVFYEVWALGYDEHYNAVDFEVNLDGGYTELEEAKKCFDYLLEHKDLVIKSTEHASDEVVHVSLVLEECTDTEDGVECVNFVEEEEIF